MSNFWTELGKNIMHKPIKSKIGDLEIPLITSFNRSYSENSPNKRLESGFEVADNIDILPVGISVSLEVSREQENFINELLKIRSSKKLFTFYYGKEDKTFENLRFDGDIQIPDGNVSDKKEISFNLKILQISELTTIQDKYYKIDNAKTGTKSSSTIKKQVKAKKVENGSILEKFLK